MFIQLLCCVRALLRNPLDLPRLRGSMVPGVCVDQPVLLQKRMPIRFGLLIKA
jgi:hypothetical protein